MALDAGSTLGPYEIVAELGAGGMGEVYRARDERLEREVAIKVLPADLAQDRDRLARFEREAKAVASLSHPNILAIHDFGRDGGVTFAVTELLEGATLREVLRSGGVPQRKALEYARQVADGLAAAHEKGVVHRDLKPENLFVTREGRIKILDFGLARLEAPADADAPTLAAAPTVDTAPGVLLGTVGYMAPEQVRGTVADHRADIFSLGAIIYELLAGRRAFQADSAVETMSAILRHDPPPMTATAEPLTPGLERLVQHCLEKNPEERFQSARDLAFALESVSSISASGLGAVSAALAREPRRRSNLWIAVLAALGVLAGLGLGWQLFRAEPPQPVQLQSLTFRRGTVLSARFAPDWQSVVYGAAWEGQPLEIYATTAGSPGSRSLDLGQADLLAVSAQGELLISMGRRFTTGWETTGTLARASLGGGAPRPILEHVHEADWGPDGESIAVVREVEGRFRLEYPVGTVLHETEGWIGDLRVSPRGDRIAFVDHPVRGDNVGSVAVVGVEGSAQSLEVPGGWGLVWAPAGDAIWVAWGGGITRVELDGDARLEWRGFGNIRLLDVAPDGRLLVAPSAVRREMVVRSPGGGTERNLTWFDWSTPRALSSDGRMVVFDEGNQSDEEGYWLYVRATDGSPPVRLDNGLGIAISPEGERVFALSHPFGEPRAVLMPVGAGEVQALDLGGIRPQPLGYWTPDGRSLIVAGADDSGAGRLYLKDLSGGGIRPVTPPGVHFSYDARAISPDGRWVVVTGPEGRLIRYPLARGEASPVPGAEPGDVAASWTGDGNALFVYRSGSLPTRVDRLDLATGERRTWLELAPADPAGVFNVDKLLMTADGASYVYSYRRLLSELVLVDGLL